MSTRWHIHTVGLGHVYIRAGYTQIQLWKWLIRIHKTYKPIPPRWHIYRKSVAMRKRDKTVWDVYEYSLYMTLTLTMYVLCIFKTIMAKETKQTK